MGDDEDTSLSFPDGPKLQLDELIDQLVERAQGVRQAQGRLRTLLRAIEQVTSDISLEVALRNVVEAACELAGARYGALGVIAADGSLEQFIHVGMTEDQVARIGHLPVGQGLLGALITTPEPIRLRHIADAPLSSGFPLHHPPMESFLGVPVRVRGEVFGNLYLCESRHGEFTAEDEELVRSLAVTAGTAIANARLYSESRLQQRWLSASAQIGSQLLSDVGEDPLRTIARRAAEIADADLVTIGLLAPDGRDLVVEVAIGARADELVARTFPVGDSLSGKAINERAPLLLRSTESTGGLRSEIADVIDPGPTMVLPLVGTSRVLGAMTIARSAGRAAFAAADLNMAAGFANHATLALELAAARADQQRMALFEDRDRIARDLHDHVIQQLFAIGLSLEGVALSVGADQAAATSIHERVADIDRTIRQIRTSIFELRGPLGAGSAGLRQELLDIAVDLGPALGFAPSLTFSGPVDSLIDEALASDVCACVREALTNVAKHARAARVDIDVSAQGSEVTVVVTDNGRGIEAGARASGLANLRARAEHRGGTFTAVAPPRGGTTLTWKAPIS